MKKEAYLGPSLAVRTPLIQDDDLKRGEFCAARRHLPQMNADIAIQYGTTSDSGNSVAAGNPH